MVELKVNMRQQNDTTFSQMLNRICKGDHTHEDVKTIQGRLVSNGDVDLSAAPFDTPLSFIHVLLAWMNTMRAK